MKRLYTAIFGTAFLLTTSVSSAQDDQKEKINTILQKLAAQDGTIINTILQELAAQDGTIQKLEKTLLPNIQPVGSLIFMASEKPPAGYLYCDGSVQSRTEFKELFEAIGETWGKGDGTTTFNLPDLRGEFIRVWSKNHTVDSGRRVGQAQGQSTAMPNNSFETEADGAHSHNFVASGDQTTGTSRKHSHTALKSSQTRPGGTNTIPDGQQVNGPEFFTKALGEHTHIVPSHNHAFRNAPAHNHRITGGDSETRPRNHALACYVKAFSHSAF